MSLKISDFLLNLFSGALETIGESKLEEVLQQLHDKNENQYKAAIFGGLALVEALLPIVTRTGNKIDDAIISALSDALETSGKSNGIDTAAARGMALDLKMPEGLTT